MNLMMRPKTIFLHVIIEDKNKKLKNVFEKIKRDIMTIYFQIKF